MRMIVYYVIPVVALILVLVFVFARSKNTTTGGEDRPLVSAPILIIVLAIAGAIGVAILMYALDLLNVV